jgi:hypothetical protein
MADARPTQTATYKGPITDTARWAGFTPRPDDVFVCTPPKCGTTWTQAICALLIFGRADHGHQPAIISPWLDAGFAPIEDVLELLDAQTHRRFVKTHSPLDGIPYHPSCIYLAVFRDPRDAFFSMINHRDNMTDQDLAASLPSGPNAFADWLTGTRAAGTWDAWPLSSIIHFFNTYWRFRDLDNVHVYHYADMTNDLPGAIARMAAALDINVTPAQLTEFVRAASFDNMKRNAAQFAPESPGFWKKQSDFFSRGADRHWQQALSDAELAAFDQRLVELLPDASARQWLCRNK